MKRLVSLLAFGLVLTGCAPTLINIAKGSELTLGAAVRGLEVENQSVFQDAVNTLAANIISNKNYPTKEAKQTAFDAMVQKYQAAYLLRSAALQALSKAVYDMDNMLGKLDGLSKVQEAYIMFSVAKPVYDACVQVAAAFQDGSVLPGLPIPPEVVAAMQTLKTIVDSKGQLNG